MGALLIALAAILWGSIGLFQSVLAGHGVEAASAAFWQTALAWAVVGVLLWLFRPDLLRVRWRDLPGLALYGAVGAVLFPFAYFLAIERAGLGLAAVLIYTAPAYVVLLAPFLGERVVPRHWAGLFIMLAGVGLISGWLDGPADGGVSSPPRWGGGLLWGLVGGAAYAGLTVGGKLLACRYSPATVLFYAYGFGTALFSLVSPPAPWGDYQASTWLWLLALATLPTLLPYGLFLLGLKYTPASTAAVWAALEPVAAALLGWLVLGQQLFPSQWAGALLIVLAAVLVQRIPIQSDRQLSRP